LHRTTRGTKQVSRGLPSAQMTGAVSIRASADATDRCEDLMARFWRAPIKAETIFKAGSFLLAVFVAALCAVWAFVSFSMKPPKERKLIENFQSHRAVYERLRDMILADQQIEAVYAGFGVKTTSSGLPRKPSEVSFSVNRYNEYVALLKQVGSNAAFKTKGNQPDAVCVGAWGAGWAGDTRHVWDCWAAREPANQVANLDDYYRNPMRPRNVFRHIDGDWYLRADW